MAGPSNFRLLVTGLDELSKALLQLPAELQIEAASIVLNAAHGAAREISEAYPEVSGNLKGGLRIEYESGRVTQRVALKNIAKHAFMYENGTEARHTSLGISRGKTEAKNVFIPRATKHRRVMRQNLIRLVESHGLIVKDN